MYSSFPTAPCTKRSFSQNSAQMQWLSKLFQVLTKFISKTFRSSCFKGLDEKSHVQLLSQSTLHITDLQQKLSENAMLRHFMWSINEIYQWDFPKVIVLKHSTKGAMCSSFRRAPCTLENLTTAKGLQKHNV